MKNSLLHHLTTLLVLAVIQRAARLVLRALWLGIAVLLAAWGLDRLFGWQLQSALPARLLWLMPPLGLAAALLPWPTCARLAWRLDRRMGLKEQVTTALQAVLAGQSNPVSALLVEDAVRLLRNSTRRVALHGWRLIPDLLSLLVVVILAFLAARSAAFPQGLALPPVGSDPLPPLGRDADAADIFPSGIPGLRSATTRGQNRAVYSPEDLDQIRVSLEALGKDLAAQSATYDLGKALQENRLEDAARRTEELAGRINDLTTATRSLTAEALSRAAQRLAGTASRSLSEQMRQAAEGIQHGRARDSADSLEDLARGLRALAASRGQQVRAGPGASIGPDGARGVTGSSRPFLRLAGGEGEPVVPVEDHPFLSPLQGLDSGAETLSTLSDNPESQPNLAPGVLLVPYSYPWMWRNVVSQYFSH